MPSNNLELLWLGKMEGLKTSYQINISLKSGSNYDIVSKGVLIDFFSFFFRRNQFLGELSLLVKDACNCMEAQMHVQLHFNCIDYSCIF